VTGAGWTFLVLGWGGVCALCAYCLARTLRASSRGDRGRGRVTGA
jgi:hypothetical protein